MSLNPAGTYARHYDSVARVREVLDAYGVPHWVRYGKNKNASVVLGQRDNRRVYPVRTVKVLPNRLVRAGRELIRKAERAVDGGFMVGVDTHTNTPYLLVPVEVPGRRLSRLVAVPFERIIEAAIAVEEQVA